MGTALNKRIFVVDDSRTLRDLASGLIRQLGGAPIPIASADECLRAVESRKPDLVLMDLDLPEMGGDECCRRIKQKGELADLPVVMMTEADGAQDVLSCWSAGADDFLQ